MLARLPLQRILGGENAHKTFKYTETPKHAWRARAGLVSFKIPDDELTKISFMVENNTLMVVYRIQVGERAPVFCVLTEKSYYLGRLCHQIPSL